jgi:hypothetical protein
MKKIQFFMLGIITAFGALFLELLVFTIFNSKTGALYAYTSSLNLTIIFSVFLEESVKIIILFQVLKKIIREGASRKDVFLSALLAGLGFSVTEIFFNLFNSQINRYLSWLDVFGLLTVHMTTFAILGYILAKKTNLNFSQFALLLPLVFSVHLFYNSLVIFQWNFGFYFLFIILSLLLILTFFGDIKQHPEGKNLPKSEIGL